MVAHNYLRVRLSYNLVHSWVKRDTALWYKFDSLMPNRLLVCKAETNKYPPVFDKDGPLAYLPMVGETGNQSQVELCQRHLGVVAIEKGAFGSRLAMVANFSLLPGH